MPPAPVRKGLRAHRFCAWGAGCGACRRGCARTALRPRLRRSHPASTCAIVGLPGGVGDTLRLPDSRLLRSGAGSPGRRRVRRLRRLPRGRVRRAAQARRAFGWMHGCAGEERVAGRRPMRRRAVPAPPRWPTSRAEHSRRTGAPLEGGWGRGTRKRGGCREAEGRPNGMQGDPDGGRGLDWRLPAAPAASHAPVWRGVAPAEFRAQNRAAGAAAVGKTHRWL